MVRVKYIRIEERVYTELRSEIASLRAQLDRRLPLFDDNDPELPALPRADKRGHYPAVETARVIIARQLIRERKAAGWTQAELGARAGLGRETINRIESGKHS